MDFLKSLLLLLDTEMTQPVPYGWFHLLFFALSILGGWALCRFFREGTEKQTRRILLILSIVVIVLEVYKQINFTFAVKDGQITADYQWYAFPWQFCSTPAYVGLVAALVRGRVHKACCAYLGTFSLFAGLAVMFYPTSVFISTIGINIQTMICHGSMITLGIYLLGTGYVPRKHRTVLTALPVFAVMIGVAMLLNEIAFRSGLLKTETFNMFFISPYCEPSLPVYSLVQNAIPYPWCLPLYVGGFTAAAWIVLLLTMAVERVLKRPARVNA